MFICIWNFSFWLVLFIFQHHIDSLKSKFKIGMDKKIYTIVSSLIPRKGIIQFVDAWKEMSKNFLEVTELHIVGDGPLRKKIENIIKNYNLENSVYLDGNIPYSEISDFLSCTDVFVLPTLEDLCSLSVFEAIASGLPVMTTIYNGARDLIIEGVNGYVFDPENSDSILDSLNKMQMSNLEVMSQESKSLACKYTDEKVMNDFYITLKNIL